MKINILMSVGSLGIGGNEVFAMSVFRNIDKTKYHVDFVVYDSNRHDFLNEIKNTDSIIYYCESKSKNKLTRFLEEKRKVYKVLRNNHYDIVHCNGCSFFQILRAAIPAKNNHSKVIAHSHNSGLPKNNIIDRLIRNFLKKYLCSIIDYGFACSDVAANSKYTKRFINSNKYALVNNAIDTNKFKFSYKERMLVRKKYDISQNDIVIGNIGRLSAQKNQVYLLEIFKEFNNIYKNSELMIVGDGELLDELKGITKKLRIESRVIFTGKQDDTAMFYSAMDCFVMPSLYEGLPFVLIEAQVNGLQCIVSDTVSKDANISGTIKYLSINESPVEWAKYIAESCNRIDESSVDKVVNSFDIKNNIKFIEHKYLALIS